MKRYFLSIFFAVAFLFYLPSHSQDHQEGLPPLELFDQVIGIENTGLANGEEYIEPHIIRDDQHKYFLSRNFLEGTVSYNSQLYSPVSMKYNIYDDILLVFLKTNDGSSSFKLLKQKIDSFKIGEHSFINVQEGKEVQGFHEVLLDRENLLLLKKHNKKIRKELDDNFTYYRFQNDDPAYAIYYNGTYFPVNSRRDFQKIFPERETGIRKFYGINKSLRKNQPDLFMTRLLQDINN